MKYLSHFKFLTLVTATTAVVTYADSRFRHEVIDNTLASGKSFSHEISNLSNIKRLDSLSYVENPYKATTGYPD